MNRELSRDPRHLPSAEECRKTTERLNHRNNAPSDSDNAAINGQWTTKVLLRSDQQVQKPTSGVKRPLSI